MTITIHQDDAGTLFQASVVRKDTGAPIELDTATALVFRFQRPDGTTVDQTAALGATTNTMELVAPVGLLNQFGTWRVQGRVTLSASSSFSTEIKPFTVAASLPAPA